MNNRVQKHFTSTLCPGTHTVFYMFETKIGLSPQLSIRSRRLEVAFLFAFLHRVHLSYTVLEFATFVVCSVLKQFFLCLFLTNALFGLDHILVLTGSIALWSK